MKREVIKAQGNWTKYPMDDGYIELHQTVGLEAATRFYIWEDADEHTKITKDLNGLVVGIAVKEK